MSLINFYGTECPHCIKMHEFLDRLEKEEGIKVEKVEVWHNEENMKKLEALDKENECGGVPFFVNTETGGSICGEATYKEIKDWAQGKVVK